MELDWRDEARWWLMFWNLNEEWDDFRCLGVKRYFRHNQDFTINQLDNHFITEGKRTLRKFTKNDGKGMEWNIIFWNYYEPRMSRKKIILFRVWCNFVCVSFHWFLILFLQFFLNFIVQTTDMLVCCYNLIQIIIEWSFIVKKKRSS